MSLEELTARFPLSPRWGAPDVLADTIQVEDVGVRIAGIRVEDSTGQVAMGSAADLDESPLDRAYFELLERTSILEASAVGGGLVRDAAGREVGRVAPQERAQSDRWRYSKSNGVAAGPTWEAACLRAEWELIERDRVLRSWYGQIRPTPTSMKRIVPEAWSVDYSFEAYVFGEGSSDVVVSAVFGFPKRAAAPLLCGFGARPTKESAVEAAARECVQRLGFLWGEEIPEKAPDFTPTPDYHQDFYLYPASHGRLRHWLEGGHQGTGRGCAAPSDSPDRERHFLDITPVSVGSNFFVAQALPRGELPLVFGDGHPSFEDLPAPLRVHPIS